MRLNTVPSNFELVSDMNTAFGNPRGNIMDFYYPETLERLRNQLWNVLDEFGEALVSLGYDKCSVEEVLGEAANQIKYDGCKDENAKRELYRDALADMNVFNYGGFHLAGLNGDQDMRAVVEAVMSRFIKDEEDKKWTIEMHARKGVTEVYFEGQFPVMVMKSAKDQPDAPKGKFLKSASYRQPVFTRYPAIPNRYHVVHLNKEDSDDMLMQFCRQLWTCDGNKDKGRQSAADQRVSLNRYTCAMMQIWSKTFGEFRDPEIQGKYEMFKETLRLTGVLK